MPIKAADIRAHVDRMSTLSRRIGSLPDPHTQLQLPPAALPPLPKWSRAVAWTPHDDAMLLLGAYLYGLGSWEQCALCADFISAPMVAFDSTWSHTCRATSQTLSII